MENLRTVAVQVWHLELLSCCWELGGEAGNLLSSESSALLVHLAVKGLLFADAKRKNQTYSCLALKQVSAYWCCCCCLVVFVDLVVLMIVPLSWLHHCWNYSAMLVVSWFAAGILLSCFWTIPVRNHKKNVTTIINLSRLFEFTHFTPLTMRTFAGVSTQVRTYMQIYYPQKHTEDFGSRQRRILRETSKRGKMYSDHSFSSRVILVWWTES